MSQTSILVKDETSSGKIINEISIPIKGETITVKDVIVGRVEHEVNEYNARLPEYFSGLVQPSEAEKTLNGYRMKEKKKVDAEKQVYVALDAYQKNGYFVLVDDKQAESLDQQIQVKSNTVVSFVKLTPLVGG